MIKTDNSTYRDRNKNKVQTLSGTDPIYRNILDFEFIDDTGTKLTLKDILEEVYINREKIKTLTNENTKLKEAIKEYINKEEAVDKALINSIELLSLKVVQAEDDIAQLKDKTKYI